MASAAVNTASRQLNPMALPPMPRIRPPRLLKGDPHPNNNPQPAGDPPKKPLVWLQGRWREQSSNAFKQQKKILTRRALRALRQRTHGLDIYAYRHVQTNQVVYSLSRALQQNHILKQLIFHGKKTVPAEVRRDMWMPYFSMHFPRHPAGVYAGLLAYQKLRDLSTQRQLTAPTSLVTTTAEDVETAKERLGDPLQIYDLKDSEDHRDKQKLVDRIPSVGSLLPKQVRAKRLMDHKATSVADAAFVLDWISAGPKPLEKLIAIEQQRLARYKESSTKKRRKINALARQAKKQVKTIKTTTTPYNRTPDPLLLPTIKRLSYEDNVLKDELTLFQNSQEGSTLAPALQEWDAYISLDRKTFDAAEHQERAAVARKAEFQALKIWYLQSQLAGGDLEPSLWKFVNQQREASLENLGEFGKERRRDIVLKRAEAEAKQAFEKMTSRTSDSSSTTPTPTLEDLIAKKQESALKGLEKEESRRSEALQKQEAKEKPSWADNWDIKVFWADLNDGRFAKSWPQNIVHGALPPLAVKRSFSPNLFSPVDGWASEQMVNGGRSRSGSASGLGPKSVLPTSPSEGSSSSSSSSMPSADAPPAGLFNRIKRLLGLGA
ncbi:hypothetical protein PV10_04196 [Exophiala mesophila]|uniref:Large ribosomal subunit protein mL67 n=1 Tax=Exophiala mesophila TaxID=212818 RepID=A0A0D1ZGK3_EXOME|nr:uncharacterized protein PV10_04196 [Exophiala mesophila]KIV92944.1 hypothetical protein PV10_04196 [Exophiala mesophila]